MQAGLAAGGLPSAGSGGGGDGGDGDLDAAILQHIADIAIANAAASRGSGNNSGITQL